MDALHELSLHAVELVFELVLNRRHAAVLQLLQRAQFFCVGGEGLLEHVAHLTSILDDGLQEAASPINTEQDDPFTSHTSRLYR